jgi:hypothetical protein
MAHLVASAVAFHSDGGKTARGDDSPKAAVEPTRTRPCHGAEEGASLHAGSCANSADGARLDSCSLCDWRLAGLSPVRRQRKGDQGCEGDQKQGA